MPASIAATGPAQALNLGIYGCTHAGKTLFAYRLLSDWRSAGRLAKASPTAERFVAAVAEEIRAYDRPQPTAVTTEGISVDVLRDGAGPWNVTLRDLRGELLTDEIDDLSGVARRGIVPTQVRQCDAFLFFFDPTSAEAPDRIDEHHAREAGRAERFVEFVLDRRENRLLPILFVQTRLDLWEGDPALRARAERWFQTVLASMQRLYQDRLGGHYPNSLVDPACCSLALSNVRSGEVERAVANAARLVDDARRYARASRRSVRDKTLSGLLFAGAFVAWMAFMVFRVGVAPPAPAERPKAPEIASTETTPRMSIYEWSPDDVARQLDVLGRLLDAHPRGPRLPELAEAKQLNRHLRWLSVKLDQIADASSATNAGFTPQLLDRMRTSWQRTVVAVRGKCEAQATLPDSAGLDGNTLAVLSAYLAGVLEPAADGGDLVAARAAYWQAHRHYVVDSLREALRTHDLASTPPLAVLQDAAQRLRTFEQEARQAAVDDITARQALLNEIRLAAQFCENRLDGSYPASWRVLEASVAATAEAPPPRRRLTWESPGQAPVDIELEFRADSADPDRGQLVGGENAHPLRLALGDRNAITLAVQSTERNAWTQLHAFSLSAAPSHGRGGDSNGDRVKVAIPSDAGSLAIFGLPWVRREQPEVVVELAWQGHEMRIALIDLPEAPALLWDAARHADSAFKVNREGK